MLNIYSKFLSFPIYLFFLPLDLTLGCWSFSYNTTSFEANLLQIFISIVSLRVLLKDLKPKCDFFRLPFKWICNKNFNLFSVTASIDIEQNIFLALSRCFFCRCRCCSRRRRCRCRHRCCRRRRCHCRCFCCCRRRRCCRHCCCRHWRCLRCCCFCCCWCSDCQLSKPDFANLYKDNSLCFSFSFDAALHFLNLPSKWVRLIDCSQFTFPIELVIGSLSNFLQA